MRFAYPIDSANFTEVSSINTFTRNHRQCDFIQLNTNSQMACKRQIIALHSLIQWAMRF